VLLELRSQKLSTAADVINAVAALRSRCEDFITYSQYAAIKYKAGLTYLVLIQYQCFGAGGVL
jgi:hypothetical protein